MFLTKSFNINTPKYPMASWLKDHACEINFTWTQGSHLTSECYQMYAIPSTGLINVKRSVRRGKILVLMS